MSDLIPRGWLTYNGAPWPTDMFGAALLEFHAAAGATIGETPMIRDPELRMRLIREESGELSDAIDGAYLGTGTFEAAVKELCDLLYVTFGTAIAWGIDITPFFERVHASNMTKVPFTKREDGKVLKSENYVPASFEGLL